MISISEWYIGSSGLKKTRTRIAQRSRAKVEAGEFCRRTNEDGVDLNRNWDEKWEPSPELSAAA